MLQASLKVPEFYLYCGDEKDFSPELSYVKLKVVYLFKKKFSEILVMALL